MFLFISVQTCNNTFHVIFFCTQCRATCYKNSKLRPRAYYAIQRWHVSKLFTSFPARHFFHVCIHLFCKTQLRTKPRYLFAERDIYKLSRQFVRHFFATVETVRQFVVQLAIAESSRQKILNGA